MESREGGEGEEGKEWGRERRRGGGRGEGEGEERRGERRMVGQLINVDHMERYW